VSTVFASARNLVESGRLASELRWVLLFSRDSSSWMSQCTPVLLLSMFLLCLDHDRVYRSDEHFRPILGQVTGVLSLEGGLNRLCTTCTELYLTAVVQILRPHSLSALVLSEAAWCVVWELPLTCLCTIRVCSLILPVSTTAKEEFWRWKNLILEVISECGDLHSAVHFGAWMITTHAIFHRINQILLRG